MDTTEGALRFLAKPYKNGMGYIVSGVTQVLPEDLRAVNFPIVGYSVIGTQNPREGGDKHIEIALYTDCTPDGKTGTLDKTIFHTLEAKLNGELRDELEHTGEGDQFYFPMLQENYQGRSLVGGIAAYEDAVTESLPGVIVQPIKCNIEYINTNPDDCHSSKKIMWSRNLDTIRKSQILEPSSLKMLEDDVSGIMHVLAKKIPPAHLTASDRTEGWQELVSMSHSSGDRSP